MGAISEAIAGSARAGGAEIRTGAEVVSIDVRDGARARRDARVGGEQLEAPTVLSGAHPRRTVLDLVGGEHFPDEVTDRDAALPHPRRLGEDQRDPVRAAALRAPRAEQQQAVLHTSLAICPSIDYLERAWQDATRGVPAEAPYIEVEVPSAIDPTLTDDDSVVLTMFTQYGPHAEADWKEGDREAYAQRCFDDPGRARAQRADAIVHYEVLAPPDLERIFGLEGGSIFQGEQGLDQMAFMRPCPRAGALRDAGRRALPLRRGHAPGRRRDRGVRPQRGASRAARPRDAGACAGG